MKRGEFRLSAYRLMKKPLTYKLLQAAPRYCQAALENLAFGAAPRYCQAALENLPFGDALRAANHRTMDKLQASTWNQQILVQRPSRQIDRTVPTNRKTHATH